MDQPNSHPMTLDEFQRRCLDTALPTALNLDYLVSGLAAEAGEVAGVYAKGVRDGRKEDHTQQLTKEVGDVLWFCCAIASQCGVTLGDLVASLLEKLSSRKERGVIQGSGDNR